MTKFSIITTINLSIYYAVNTEVWASLVKGIRVNIDFSLYDLIEDAIYDNIDNGLLRMIDPAVDSHINQETI